MSLAHYLLQVNIYLVIFFCFYKLLLDKETYFTLNRCYLLAAGLLSLIIPFMRFEWFGKQEVTKTIYVSVDQLNDFVTQVSVMDDAAARFNWGNLVVMVYLMGVIGCLGRLVIQLVAVRKLLRTISAGAAFSFFRQKVIHADVPEIATVNLHEDVHVKQLHTLDVLFFELIGAFAWFNPVVYIYKKTIKNIHEFLADEAAAKFQGDKEAYALLLLSKAFGITPNNLTNGFTKSLIKKRILMLHRQRSKKAAVLKYGLFVPLFALTLVLSSATIRKNRQILAMANKIPLDDANLLVSDVIESPLSMIKGFQSLKAVPKETASPQAIILKPTTVTTPEESDNTASLNGFYAYLSERIQYPAAAASKSIQGHTIINFSVRNGKISNVVVQNELGEGCDEEVVSEILAYNDFFQKDGNFSLKVTFKLEGAESEFKNENASSGERYTTLPNIVVTGYASPSTKEESADHTLYNFITVASPPTYPGGMEAFYKFLANNIKYPAAAVDNEIQGNVHVSFTVEKDGELSDIKIERKLGFGTDEEALRVLKTTKRWNPGIQNGKPVRVKYNIPIKFSFDPGNTERVASAVASIRLKTYAEEEEPLVMVDNKTREYSYLKSMDNRNIASINVLSGSNAMLLYGKAAENGAILIKSKNRKPTIITGTLTTRN